MLNIKIRPPSPTHPFNGTHVPCTKPDDHQDGARVKKGHSVTGGPLQFTSCAKTSILYVYLCLFKKMASVFSCNNDNIDKTSGLITGKIKSIESEELL